jgi:mannose-6-phosphate isomerase-like protein (cupin superfamily)
MTKHLIAILSATAIAWAQPAWNVERSNEDTAVDIDRFIGRPDSGPAHLSHGGLVFHTILRNGDPYKPGLSGSVLEYRKDLSLAKLLPKSKTQLATLTDEHFFFVKRGEGRLDDGKRYWDLKPGVAILAPPNVPHRFTNMGDNDLEMTMLRWTAAGAPGAELLVRDTSQLPYCEENAHWNNMSRCIFGATDGLFQNERMYIVMLQPWSMSAPHVHGEGTEEIWLKLTPGVAIMNIGSELREMPENSAYLVPPTGTTSHANLNLSKDKTEWWLYIARGRAPAPGAPARGGRGGNRPPNPNLSREVKDSIVQGKPVQ